jgi:hypothetical protein
VDGVFGFYAGVGVGYGVEEVLVGAAPGVSWGGSSASIDYDCLVPTASAGGLVKLPAPGHAWSSVDPLASGAGQARRSSRTASAPSPPATATTAPTAGP